MRRKSLGLSQGAVAAAVGLTFQQLQKYERGANRISASKLHALAHILKTSVDWFFEGLPDPVTPEHALAEEGLRLARISQAFLMSPEGLDLAQMFPSLPRAARRRILDLMGAMSDEAIGNEDAG